MLRMLCGRYTDLTIEDIEKLETINSMFEYFCELTETDMFIDCFFKDEEKAIVVAHSKSRTSLLYKNNITGEIVLPQNEPVVFFTRQTGASIRDIKGVTQENKIAMQRSIPIKNNNGKIIAVLVEEKDMTRAIYKNKKIQQLEKTMNQLTEAIFEISGNDNLITNSISEGILTFNENMILTYINPEGQKLFKSLGFGNNFLGLSFDDMTFSREISREKVLSKEITEENLSIGNKHLIIKYKVNNTLSEPLLIMLIEDVSDLKEKEKELINKSVMVQEMHHRIKNNLQTISSILSIQSRRSNCIETKEALSENINRINSIATIHEILTNSPDQIINIKSLFEDIMCNIKSYAITDNKNIKISIVGDDVEVVSDKAISIAIIINELITNSIVHGFSNKSTGDIKIIIGKGGFYSHITIEDNGCGFDVNNLREGSLGMDLVKIMVNENLRGNLKIHSKDYGTTISFDFKNNM